MIGYNVDRFSIDLDHDSEPQIRAYLDAILEELLLRYERHGPNVFAGYSPRCPCDGHDAPMVRGSVPEDERLWHCSACLLTARQRMAAAKIGAGMRATPEVCGVLPTESGSVVFYCEEHDWITCRLCAGESSSNPWEVRERLPKRPDPLLAELPATKRQNLLLSEIEELLERTFKNSDEDKELLERLEDQVPLFRGRLRDIASENGKPAGLEPRYRLALADATVRFLEKIRASVPAGVFDEVSARARAVQEEEFTNVHGDTGADEYIWHRGWAMEKKDPGLPARTVVLKGCEHLGCEGPLKKSLSTALGEIAVSLMDVSTINDGGELGLSLALFFADSNAAWNAA
jgi:hypothetical protein